MKHILTEIINLYHRIRYLYIAAKDRVNFLNYNLHLLNEQSKIVSKNNALLSDQKKIQDIYDRLASDCQKCISDTEKALNEQSKIVCKNNALLSDQKKIQDIYDRLASDCQKCISDTEKALKGASLIYRRDDPLSQDKFKNLAHILRPYRVKSFPKIRMGRRGDGGYVMLDDFSKTSLAISCGIGGDVSWDLDIAKLGIKVLQYDHSIGYLPDQHSNFNFFQKMISKYDSDNSISIPTILKTYNNESRYNILKMDIEGSEWDIIDNLSSNCLNKFSQIVIELHDFEELYNEEWYNRAKRILEKLSSMFRVIHVHGANTGRLAVFSNLPFPTVIEITWANRSLYEMEESDEIFPTELDAPTDLNFADIFLGKFVFKD